MNPPLFASAAVDLLSLLPFFHPLLADSVSTSLVYMYKFVDFLVVGADNTVIYLWFHLKCTII